MRGQVRIGLLVLLAAAVLAAGIVTAISTAGVVHLGLIQEVNSGRVLAVESESVASGIGLRSGDVVPALGGVPSGETPTLIAGVLPISIRQGDLLTVRWAMVPGGGRFWTGDLLLLVASIFWLAGFGVTLWGARGAATTWFVLFAFFTALALATPLAVTPAVPLLRWLPAPAAFGALVWYLWLQRTLVAGPGPGRIDRRSLLLSAQAAVVVLLVDAGPSLFGAAAGPTLAAIAGLDLLAMLLLAHLLPLQGSRSERPAPVRRRLRLALLLGLVAWLPALALGWAPLMAALLGHGYATPLSPYTGAASLLVLALAYPTVVTRGDLFVLDAAVRRLAASVVVAAILLALVFAILHLIDLTAAPQGDDRLAIALALLACTVPVFDPLRRLLQHGLEHRLGVLEPTYTGSLEAISDRLLQASDEAGIAAVLTGALPARLGLTHVAVWLRAADGHWRAFSPDPDAQTTTVRQAALTQPVPLEVRATLVPGLAPPAALQPDQLLPPPPEIAATGVVLCVPVYIGDVPRGLLLLGPRRSQDPYRRPEREALLLLSRQIAAALLFVDQLAELRNRNADLARLTSRLARAREEERKHLSHELHDTVAQDLMVLTRQLRRHQAGAIPDALWQDMIAQAQEALTTIRRICNDLRPAILDMGLASALRELVDRAATGIPAPHIAFERHGAELRLDEEREFALFRMCQEALTNVLKHAAATEVTISVRFSLDAVEVEVADNGAGFSVPERLEEIGGDHLGLLGMRERLTALGGQMRVESQPGHGTRVWAHMPAGE
jgi:signal transduction histidine kinase